MLRSWYGPERGNAEFIRYEPQAVPVSEALRKIAAKRIPAWMLRIEDIQNNWESIAGTENAKRSFPARLYENILYVEVKHPAYRLALESPRVKNLILAKVQALVGANACRDIRFVMAGGRCE